MNLAQVKKIMDNNAVKEREQNLSVKTAKGCYSTAAAKSM